MEELGRALEADKMFHGDLVLVTPLIGKLRLLWFHCHNVHLPFLDRVF